MILGLFGLFVEFVVIPATHFETQKVQFIQGWLINMETEEFGYESSASFISI